MRGITGRIRQELQELMINCNRRELSQEELKTTVERLNEESWLNWPVREERLSAVLHPGVMQASSLMAQASPDTPFAAKGDVMMKFLKMKILQRKFN
jgi:hypothetical protein